VHYGWLIDWFLVFNATFSNISAISWWPVLEVEEAGENHRSWASNWELLSLAAVSRVHPFCNLQSRVRTHAVFVIGLYELLVIQLTNSLSYPGSLCIMYFVLNSIIHDWYSSIYYTLRVMYLRIKNYPSIIQDVVKSKSCWIIPIYPVIVWFWFS
jgi:hypothetical protein